MLWETEKPEPTIMRIDDKQLELFYVDQKVLEVYNLTAKLGTAASNPVPRLAMLRDHFEIEKKSLSADALTLRLVPKTDALKQYVDDVVVEVDLQQGVAKQFTVTDPDGEQTIIRFSDYKLNAGVTDEQLKLTPPPGTKRTAFEDR